MSRECPGVSWGKQKIKKYPALTGGVLESPG
jgi:hypothetical protein